MDASRSGWPSWSQRAVPFALGVALVLLMQLVASLGEDNGPSAAGDSIASRALVDELRRLREVVQDGRDAALTRVDPAGPAVVTAADAASVPRERLSPWFEQLDQRLAALVDVLASAGRQGSATPPAALAGTLSELVLDHEGAEPEVFPPQEDFSTMGFSKRHVLWREQQVLDAYGVPDAMSVNPHGELIWSYFEGDDDLEFVFYDGRVLRVEW